MDWAVKLERQHPELALLVHMPNGGKREYLTAALLKAEGVKAGYPDYLLDVARGGYHGLRIELKAEEGGTRENQREWIGRLRAEGYCVFVCVGWRRAADLIREYLRLPPGQLFPAAADETAIFWMGELR